MSNTEAFWPDVPVDEYGGMVCPMPGDDADTTCGAELRLDRSYSIPLEAEADVRLDPSDAVVDSWEVGCIEGHVLDAGCEEQDGRTYDHRRFNELVARIWRSGQ